MPPSNSLRMVLSAFCASVRVGKWRVMRRRRPVTGSRPASTIARQTIPFVSVRRLST